MSRGQRELQLGTGASSQYLAQKKNVENCVELVWSFDTDKGFLCFHFFKQLPIEPSRLAIIEAI